MLQNIIYCNCRYLHVQYLTHRFSAFWLRSSVGLSVISFGVSTATAENRSQAKLFFFSGGFFGVFSLSLFNQVQFFVCFSSVAQLGDGVWLSFLLVVLCLRVQGLDQFSSRSSFFELAISLAFILTTLTIVQDKSRNYIVTLTIGGKIAKNFLWNIVNSRGTAIGITPPSWNGLLDPKQRSPQQPAQQQA